MHYLLDNVLWRASREMPHVAYSIVGQSCHASMASLLLLQQLQAALPVA